MGVWEYHTGTAAPGGVACWIFLRAARRDVEEKECCLGGKTDLESDRAQARDSAVGREEKGGAKQARPFRVPR